MYFVSPASEIEKVPLWKILGYGNSFSTGLSIKLEWHWIHVVGRLPSIKYRKYMLAGCQVSSTENKYFVDATAKLE